MIFHRSQKNEGPSIIQCDKFTVARDRDSQIERKQKGITIRIEKNRREWESNGAKEGARREEGLGLNQRGLAGYQRGQIRWCAPVEAETWSAQLLADFSLSNGFPPFEHFPFVEFIALLVRIPFSFLFSSFFICLTF